MIGAFKLNSIGKFTVTAVAEVIRKKKGITAIGNAQVDTAQSKFGGASALFDGSGDYLNFASDPSFALNDFTIELWYRASATNNALLPFLNFGNHLFYIGYSGGNPVYDVFASGSNRTTLTAISGWSLNTWYHVAYVRSGNNISIYHNGTLHTTGVWGTQITNASPNTIGLYGGSYFFQGHMDEIRVSNTARYTANFTAPTAPFVNDDNTLLLIHADGTDASTFFEDDNGVRSPNTFRAFGNARISTTRSKFGGSSLYFDGSGDYAWGSQNISFPNGQDFTWEFWYNEDVSQNIKFIAGNTNQDIFIGRAPGIVFNGNIGIGVVGIGWNIDFGSAPALDTWHHICVQRSGTTVYCYINGTQVVSTSTFGTRDWTWRVPVLGAELAGTTPYNGYLDEIRWSNTVRYSLSGFTSPTSPFVNDENTLCLIHGDGTNDSTVFRDDNGVRSPKGIQAIGNAQVDTAQSKFGGSSAVFDGADDALGIEDTSWFNFGAGNFTVECWFRYADGSAYPALVTTWSETSSTRNFFLGIEKSTAKPVFFFVNSAGNINTSMVSSTTISTNTWHHLAIVGDSTNFKLYLNGTQVSSLSRQTLRAPQNAFRIGNTSDLAQDYAGWIDEVRVSNTARYTANFTAPTVPFQNDANTVLLLHMDGTDASTVFFDDNGRTPTP